MKKLLSFILSFMMVFTMMPMAASAAFAETSSGETEISYGSPGKDYESGKVIVCVKGGAKALAESGIFDKKPLLSAQNAADKNDDGSGYEGMKGTLDSAAVRIEENLMSFEAEEAQIDRIAAENDSEYVEALQGEYPRENAGERMLKAGSAEEDYSLILLKSNKEDVTELIEELEKLPCVKFAEPNMICTTEAYAPKDATEEPMYDYQWYSDSSKATKGIDINATETYGKSEFSSQKEVVVAVMDSGVDYTHPDMKDAMWADGEKYSSLTQLGGGKYGINTSGAGDTDDPMDTTIGHGTHCASTIASAWANKEGIAGVNGNAGIMACRWMSDTGYTANFIKAMEYVMAAKEAGVNVVTTSNSWGPSLSTAFASKTIEAVAEAAADKGITSCFAAGNSSLNHDKYTNQDYNSPYMLIVGAMDSAGNPAYFSDRGARTVDVFSPGTQILAATSLQEKVDFMPPQYLPWLQDDSDSFFYEDFENFENSKITLSSYKYDNESEEKSNVIEENRKGAGYLSDNSCKVNIHDEIKADDSIGIEMDIPVTEILKDGSSLPESEKYYMAFQAGVDNIDFESDEGTRHTFLIQYCTKETAEDGQDAVEKWETIDGARWRCIDENWSISSTEITQEQMNQLVSAAEATDGVLKLRLTTNVTSKSSNADFYIDSFGLGTERSNYYYSDGTSMATPVAAAITSIIAGSRDSLPDSGEDVLEVIAEIKGGVSRNGTHLSEVCKTQGCVQADAAYKSEGEMYPVPDTAVLSSSGEFATIYGHFFGSNKGTVAVNGRNAKVNSWTDKKIIIEIPGKTEYGMLEYTVTRSDGRSGRDFGIFMNRQSGDKVYKSIPIGDFTYGEYKTGDMLPVRIAADEDGIMALLVDDECEQAGLEFYSFKNKEWTQVQLPEGIPFNKTFMECTYSIVGGEDQFYLLYSTERDGSWLITYSTKEQKWLYTARLNESFESGEFIGLDGNGKLYACGGMGSSSDPGVVQIYPDTGNCSKSYSVLPEEYECLSGDYLISGDMHIIAGMNEGVMGRSTEGQTGLSGSPVSNPIVLSDGEWKQKATPFFEPEGDTSDGRGGAGLDHGQVYIGAYGALDSGFILAGPSRDIDKAGMVDTWVYNAQKDTYTALDARVDSTRMRMQAGVCRNGRFYVMGNSAENGKTFLKYLDLSEYNVRSTDNEVNAETERIESCMTACGSTWLNDENGSGYYVKDKDGVLTKEGATSANYNVRYDSKNNRITLRNFELKDIHSSRAAGRDCAIYSDRDLTVELIGDNTIDPDEDVVFAFGKSICGIYCKGSIDFAGKGNLNVKSGNNARHSYGVYSEKTVNFNSEGIINCRGELGDKETASYMTGQEMGAYGIAAGENVNISKGKVNVTADSIIVEYQKIGEMEPVLRESIGIDAEGMSVSGKAELTVNAGDSSSLGEMHSVAVRTHKAAEIGASKVTASVGTLYDYETKKVIEDGTEGNMNRCFSQAPVLMKGTSADIRYGENKSAAEAAGPKPFSDISSKLTEKYIHIGALGNEPSPDINGQPVELLKAKAAGERTVKLSWNGVQGAAKYVVYGQKNGKKFKKLKTTTGRTYTVKKIKGRKLTAHKVYKFYVVAYTPAGKVKSRTIHFITGNTMGKYANAKSIRVNPASLTLEKGKTASLKVKTKIYRNKKHIKKSYGAAVRYISDCPTVATVNSKGTITALAPGKATIYIQDIGGRYSRTAVTVR